MTDNKKDIDSLLNRWYDIKQEISELESKLSKCKSIIEKYMNDKDTDSVSNNTITATRREMSRTSISKKDLPESIWNKYSKESHFVTFTLRKKGKKELL